VARENRYLALVEAPPVARSRGFVLQNTASGATHFVAREGSRVVRHSAQVGTGGATLRLS
jgi:hypothetical protein